MGVTKVGNNWNDLVKGSLTRQKLQNSKGYAKSPEFFVSTGANYFREEVCQYKFEVNLIPSSLNYIFFMTTTYMLHARVMSFGMS